MTNQTEAIPEPPASDYVLAIHELGHAWPFHNVGQQFHHIALGSMKDCPACKTLPSPLDNSAQAILKHFDTQEHAHIRQPDVEGHETLEQNIRCSLAGAAAQEICNAVNHGEFRYELKRVVDNLADADFMDLEDAFCELYPDWESNEELQEQTDQLLQMIFSELLDQLPAEKLKTMAELLVHKRLLLAEELIWNSSDSD
jgi:hypothetical protein